MRRTIADTSRLERGRIASIIKTYGVDRQLRAVLREIWTHFSEPITAFARASWETVISDIHVANASQRLGGPVSREAVVESAVETSLAPFVARDEYQWVDEYAGLTVEAWLAKEDATLLNSLSEANAAMILLILPLCQNDLQRQQVVGGISKLSTVQGEVIMGQRALLERKEILISIGDDGAQYRDALLQLMDGALTDTSRLRNATGETVDAAQRVLHKSAEITAVSEQSAEAMQSAARTSAGLIAVIHKILQQLTDAEQITLKAAQRAEEAVSIGAHLLDHAQTIESILGIIHSIAGQTNLLALNATIEAARAGQAGRGFAVVAQEVKTLANQTALAANDIRDKVAQIQTVTQQSAQASAAVSSAILDVTAQAQEILGHVNQQSDIVADISSAIDETATGAISMSKLIADIHADTDDVVRQIQLLADGFETVDATINQANDDARTFVGKLASLA